MRTQSLILHLYKTACSRFLCGIAVCFWLFLAVYGADAAVRPEPNSFADVPRERLEIGGTIHVTGPVKVTMLDSYPHGYPLFLLSPGPPRRIGTGGEVGKQVFLGDFPPNTELVFGMLLNGSGVIGFEKSIKYYLTGPGGRNFDHFPHALVARLNEWNWRVGFEDIPNSGGDRDFNDLVFQVSVKPPYILRFTEPSSPTVLPTVRPRAYLDMEGKRRLFPDPRREEPILCRLQVVSENGSPIDNLKIHVSAQGEDTGAGHDAGKHRIPRPHGWLFAQEPHFAAAAEEKSAATDSTANVPADSGATKPDQKLPSESDKSADAPELRDEVLDRPLEPEEAGGDPTDAGLDLLTDDAGNAEFYYLPSEIAGTEILTAQLTVKPGVEPAQQTVTVKLEGLVDLAATKFPGRLLTRRDAHPSPYWLTQATAAAVTHAAALYRDKQQSDAEVQQIVQQLTQSGYEFPYQLAKNRVVTAEPDLLHPEAGSVAWGGLFDSAGDYVSRSWGHRKGEDLDVMTRHLVRGEPLKATLAQAVGDPALREAKDTERDTLVRRLQYRRLQLMIAALKESGGRFIPESAHFSEGDHLHVSFGPISEIPVPPQEPTLPPKPAVALPGGRTLAPANPLH